MKISRLSDASGISIATIKYYLREGLLPAGERTHANQASYGDEHLRRLRLIRGLIEVGGLSVATARTVIEAVDSPEMPLSWVFGVAQYAISEQDLYAPVAADSPGLATVMAAVNRMGWQCTNDNPGIRGAARVLDTFADLGQDHLAELAPEYSQAAEIIAHADLALVGHRSTVAEMAETVVVGTVLGDALIASLRRIAQQHVSYQVFPPTQRSTS